MPSVHEAITLFMDFDSCTLWDRLANVKWFMTI